MEVWERTANITHVVSAFQFQAGKRALWVAELTLRSSDYPMYGLLSTELNLKEKSHLASRLMIRVASRFSRHLGRTLFFPYWNLYQRNVS